MGSMMLHALTCPTPLEVIAIVRHEGSWDVERDGRWLRELSAVVVALRERSSALDDSLFKRFDGAVVIETTQEPPPELDLVFAQMAQQFRGTSLSLRVESPGGTQRPGI